MNKQIKFFHKLLPYLAVLIAVFSLIKALEISNQTSQELDRVSKKIEKIELYTAPEMEKIRIQNNIIQYFEAKKLKAIEALKDKYSKAENIKGSDRIYGKKDAEISLIEFSDIECPYCKKFHNTPKQIVEASNGEINWVWKHMPLSFHNPAAKNLAVVSECVAQVAGNQAFWIYTDLLFENTKGNGQGVSDPLSLSDQLLINRDQMNQCLSQPDAEKRVLKDMAFASKAGVTGTPSVFLIPQESGKVLKLPGYNSKEQVQLGIKQLKAQVKGL